jgi:hypothetical protein
MPEKFMISRCFHLYETAEETNKMKLFIFAPITLALTLGACAIDPPKAPRVTALAPDSDGDRKFARDDSACRTRARTVTDKEAANGEVDLQRHYDAIYSNCMIANGYQVEAPATVRYVYGSTRFAPYWRTW